MSADEKKKWRGLANANAKSRLEKTFADTQASSNFVPAADGAGVGARGAAVPASSSASFPLNACPGADLHGPGLFAGHRGALQPVNGNSWNPPAAQMPRMVDGSGWDPTAAAPILGLGEQWVTLTHPSTSEPYYWNQLTGVTQWQQPF